MITTPAAKLNLPRKPALVRWVYTALGSYVFYTTAGRAAAAGPRSPLLQLFLGVWSYAVLLMIAALVATRALSFAFRNNQAVTSAWGKHLDSYGVFVSFNVAVTAGLVGLADIYFHAAGETASGVSHIYPTTALVTAVVAGYAIDLARNSNAARITHNE